MKVIFFNNFWHITNIWNNINFFSPPNSSITDLTLIPFWPINVQTGSISSKLEETNIFVLTQACLTTLSIEITPSSISGTFSAKIAVTSSALFLDNITLGEPVSFLETSATYKKNLAQAT